MTRSASCHGLLLRVIPSLPRCTLVLVLHRRTTSVLVHSHYRLEVRCEPLSSCRLFVVVSFVLARPRLSPSSLPPCPASISMSRPTPRIFRWGATITTRTQTPPIVSPSRSRTTTTSARTRTATGSPHSVSANLPSPSPTP